MQVGIGDMRAINVHAATQIGRAERQALVAQRHALELCMHANLAILEFLERQEQVHLGADRTLALDAVEGAVGQGVQRGRAQVTDGRQRITAALRMDLEFPGLEIGEMGIAVLDAEPLCIRFRQMHAHAFVVEHRLPCHVLEQRPALAITQDHAVDIGARDENAAAVAKRKLAQGALQDDLSPREVASNESLVKPRHRRRADHAMRQVVARSGDIAFIDVGDDGDLR